MFKFLRTFSVHIHMKSGSVIEFPRGYFTEFTVIRNGLGELSEIKWTIRNKKGQVLYLKVSEIVSIVTFY